MYQFFDEQPAGAVEQENENAQIMQQETDQEKQRRIRQEGLAGIGWGVLWLAGGIGATVLSTRYIFIGAIVYGIYRIGRGFIDLL